MKFETRLRFKGGILNADCWLCYARFSFDGVMINVCKITASTLRE